MNFFAEWLSAAGISAADYARASGISPNTIYRRRRGELKTPPEVAYLLGELAKARGLGLEAPALRLGGLELSGEPDELGR